MDPTQPFSPRRRMQALLAIPDSQRTEAEWDELNELEIKLAPGNRDDNPGNREMSGSNNNNNNNNKGGGRNGPGPGSSPRPEGGPGGPRRKPARKFHKRPPKVGPP